MTSLYKYIVYVIGGCLLFQAISVDRIAQAQAQTGRITGTVRAADTNDIISGATIEVSGADLAEPYRVASRSDGGFTIDGLPAGRYIVTATFIGYRRASVSNVEVPPAGTATTDFMLVIAPYELDAIVVSASRQAESIIYAPASISKVEAQAIQKQATANSYASQMRTVPGIDYTQRGVLSEAFNARGYNEAFNSRMLVLLDGRRIRATSEQAISMPIPKDDLQHLEIIVGPGSALYGPDAISGVVSVVSKDPRHTQGTVLSLSGGSRDTFKSRFRHATQRGKWGWKAAGEFQRARDYERVDTFFSPDSAVSVTDDPDFDADAASGNVGLFYYPTGTSSLSLSLGGSRVDLIDWFDTGRLQLDNLTQFYQHVVYSDPRFYFSLHHTGVNNGDTFALHTRALSRLAGLPADQAQQLARIDQKKDLTGAEGRYRFSPPVLNSTHITLGFDYFQERVDSEIVSNGEIAIDQLGIYGQATTDLRSGVTFIAATRVDFHDTYETQISPKAGLIVKPHQDMAFRATVNRAFRSPTSFNQYLLFNVQPGVVARGNSRGYRFDSIVGAPLPAAFANGIPALRPEENTTVELGYKGMIANSVFLNVSGYRSAYKNFISTLQPIGDPLSGIFVLDDNGTLLTEQTLTYLNFGEQTVLGADIGANVYATDHMVFRGNVSFIDAGTFKSAQGLTQPFNTPERILNLGFTLSDIGMIGTSFDLMARHVSAFAYSAGIVAGTIPDYTTLDIHLGYRTNRNIAYRLSLTNVFDNSHIETIGGAEIGRLIVGEVQYGF